MEPPIDRLQSFDTEEIQILRCQLRISELDNYILNATLERNDLINKYNLITNSREKLIQNNKFTQQQYVNPNNIQKQQIHKLNSLGDIVHNIDSHFGKNSYNESSNDYSIPDQEQEQEQEQDQEQIQLDEPVLEKGYLLTNQPVFNNQDQLYEQALEKGFILNNNNQLNIESNKSSDNSLSKFIFNELGKKTKKKMICKFARNGGRCTNKSKEHMKNYIHELSEENNNLIRNDLSKKECICYYFLKYGECGYYNKYGNCYNKHTNPFKCFEL